VWQITSKCTDVSDRGAVGVLAMEDMFLNVSLPNRESFARAEPLPHEIGASVF
jgi:hypothetical protein